MSDEPNTTEPAAPWSPSPQELASMAARDRGYARQAALTAAAHISAPGTPAERVLFAAATFYDYLTTDEVLEGAEEPE